MPAIAFLFSLIVNTNILHSKHSQLHDNSKFFLLSTDKWKEFAVNKLAYFGEIFIVLPLKLSLIPNLYQFHDGSGECLASQSAECVSVKLGVSVLCEFIKRHLTNNQHHLLSCCILKAVCFWLSFCVVTGLWLISPFESIWIILNFLWFNQKFKSTKPFSCKRVGVHTPSRLVPCVLPWEYWCLYYSSIFL